MSEKLGQYPAFPISEEQMDRIEKYPHMSIMGGMSKRFYAACAAMQGILANPVPDLVKMSNSIIAEFAYRVADELLKQENE